jgi:hypothetical protein
MARKKPHVVLVVPRLSADEVQRVQRLRHSGAAGTHGQGPRRERCRSASRAAEIRRASE